MKFLVLKTSGNSHLHKQSKNNHTHVHVYSTGMSYLMYTRASSVNVDNDSWLIEHGYLLHNPLILPLIGFHAGIKGLQHSSIHI